LTLNGLHGVISQKMVLFFTTALFHILNNSRQKIPKPVIGHDPEPVLSTSHSHNLPPQVLY
jgi:hypothetical protein